MLTKSAYARAGVDIDIEAQASIIMYEASRWTYRNRWGKVGKVETLFNDFAGLRIFNVGGLPKDARASLNVDGAGTKVEFPQRTGRYDGIGHDLIAMLADDAAIRGGEPALIANVLDVRTLAAPPPSTLAHLERVKALANGMVAAAGLAGVAVINGEIAQMGAVISGYGNFPFTWSGSCIWFGRRRRLISGLKVRPGDAVVALREKGFRANGLSLVREVYEKRYGPEWHAVPFGLTAKPLGEAVALPSVIYAKLLVRLTGGYHGKPVARIHAAAHITGGGIPEKLGRVLRPSGCGAKLFNLFAPGSVATHCQRIGGFSDYEAYDALNMGQGMLLVTPDPGKVLEEAHKRGIEAQEAGFITPKREILLTSRGLEAPGKRLCFRL